MNIDKVAVFGGAGFIGSKLTRELVKRNKHVWVYDIYKGDIGTRYVDGAHYFTNIADIRNFESVSRVVEGMDAVVNMAVLPHQVGNMRPLEDFEVTARGTLNILEAARKHDVKKVLFTSSAMVYGEPIGLPLVESMKCVPKVPYAVSKLAAEEYCRVYSELYGLNVVVLRYTNVYGPGQTGSFLFPELFGRIKRGEPITIYGDGKQTRDFCVIDDVTAANIAALEADIKFGLYNVGLGKSSTVISLVKMLYEITGAKENLVFLPERSFEIKYISASITRAQAALKWAPKVELRDGLEETWEWFKTKS